jgi:trans-aconitate 2-methyltransferase
MAWDPRQYLRFETERARPFHDLVNRIAVEAPTRVVDLGCGPGNATATLLHRWPAATVLGIDASTEMVAKASELARPRLRFAAGDIRTWRPEGPLDVIVSNAALQWVPAHDELFAGWLDALTPGGALAFQVPSNVEGPAPAVFRAVATGARWADRLTPVATGTGPSQSVGGVHTGPGYLDRLARLGCAVDAWETTYLHLLPGEDPVLEWYAGSGLRPYLEALDPGERAEFRADVAAGLREAFPARPYGTVLPFRRIFVIAYRR